MRRKVTGRIPSLLAVRCHGRIQAAGSDACPGHRALAPGRIGRLSRPHRGAPPVSIYAALIGRRPNRYGRAHTQAAERIPRPHRELSRYLCKLRDWAQAQSYAAGLPAVCHKWSGALPPQAYATTRHSPRLGHTPRPSVATWAPSMPTPPRKRLRDLPSWSGPMAIAGILPLALINAVHTAKQERAEKKKEG